jgi:hypothetical protein
MTTSVEGQATYTIAPVLSTPAFSHAAGTYTVAQSVAITDATAGATTNHTLNGATPTTASTKYTAAIDVSASPTIEAIAVKTGYINSAAASAAYIIGSVLPTPTSSVAAGTYSTPLAVTIRETTAGTTNYYITDGTTPTTASAKYTSSVPISATGRLMA